MFDWLYWIFGKILFGIDWVLSGGGNPDGFHNTGMCIIILTIIVYILMYPLNSKQQKSTRLMTRINPELKEIQRKYKNKKDQASQMKMNEETQALYAKYGISPFGGCLPLLVTMPILWCLYRVMMNMPDYVSALKFTAGVPAQPGDPGYFLGLDVNVSPIDFFRDKANHPYGWIAFLIPILAMALQFLNSKILQPSSKNGEQDQMGQSMKMMNYMMPLMSGFFCLSLNMGIGLYWIMGSLFRIVQGLIVNKKIDKISLDELIEKNKEKAAAKTKKLKERNEQMGVYSNMKTSTIKSASSYQNKPTKDSTSSDSSDKNDTKSDSKSEDKSDKSASSDGKYEQGSIAGYAHMMSNNKKD
ncbi:MAG: YidC/Oxa1 family membrane protein insertase [Eubacterium sp.]|nr:YidC/Oxa1 family membrane protein insertase [Eubacterium sp.]